FVRTQLPAQALDKRRTKLLYGQLLPDHACRTGDDVLRGNAEFCGYHASNSTGIVQAQLACGHIGIFAVDDQRLSVPIHQTLTPDDHWGTAEQTLRKCPGRSRPHGRINHREVQRCILDAYIARATEISLRMKRQRWRSCHRTPPYRTTELTITVVLLQSGQTAVDDLDNAVDLSACDAHGSRQHDHVRRPCQQAFV